MNVGTWNCRVTVPLHKVRRDLERILPHVEILGLQEWGGKDRERLLERLRGYDYAKPGDRTGSVSRQRGRVCRGDGLGPEPRGSPSSE